MIKRIFYSYLTIKVNHQRPSILISGAILYFNDLRERRVTVENAFDNPVLSHADIIQKLGYLQHSVLSSVNLTPSAQANLRDTEIISNGDSPPGYFAAFGLSFDYFPVAVLVGADAADFASRLKVLHLASDTAFGYLQKLCKLYIRHKRICP